MILLRCFDTQLSNYLLTLIKYKPCTSKIYIRVWCAGSDIRGTQSSSEQATLQGGHVVLVGRMSTDRMAPRVYESGCLFLMKYLESINLANFSV